MENEKAAEQAGLTPIEISITQMALQVLIDEIDMRPDALPREIDISEKGIAQIAKSAQVKLGKLFNIKDVFTNQK